MHVFFLRDNLPLLACFFLDYPFLYLALLQIKCLCYVGQRTIWSHRFVQYLKSETVLMCSPSQS